MWVPGSVAFLLPLFGIGIRLLFGARRDPEASAEVAARPEPWPRRVAGRLALPIVGQPRRRVDAAAFDLLRLPLLGRFLRWRHARLSLQVPLLLLAGLVDLRRSARAAGRRDEPGRRPAVDPLARPGDPGAARGRQRLLHGVPVHAAADARPPLAPARAGAGRGGCGASGWRSSCSPCFLWAYEAFALWDSPWWTAWIVARLLRRRPSSIDGFFRGASFCKYVCPIGQFNFVQSLVSPLEVKVRDPDVCASCRTKDCIRGARRHPRLRAGPVPAAEVEQPGLHVLPRLCPRLSARQCRHPRRAARAATCGAIPFAPGSAGSASGPTWRPSSWSWSSAPSPMPREWSARSWSGETGWRPLLGLRSPLLVTSLSYVLGLVVLPALMVGTAAALWPPVGPARDVTAGGGDAVLVCAGPAGVRHVAGALQLSLPDELRRGRSPRPSGSPATWAGPSSGSRSGRAPAAGRSRTGCPGWRSSPSIWGCSSRCTRAIGSPWLSRERASQALKVLAPWAVLIVLLFAAGVWIVLQPMQMRGTLSGAG